MSPATNNTRTQPTDAESFWIHVVPKGELPNSEAGIVQVLDDTALNTITAGIEADKIRLGSRWPGIYGGREHHIYDEDKDSEALAWFKEFSQRGDGIWANANGLTDIGRDAIRNGRYKFTSFAADRKHIEPLGGNRFRVLKIDTIGFTNQANGKELLTPITNRKAGLFLNADSLSPRAAGDEFSKIVNRVKTEKGWNFERAWDHCRQTEKAIYNRMSLPGETLRPSRNAVSHFESAKFASDALYALAEKERRGSGCSFADAWPRICNRRTDLLRLANRELPQSAWADLESKAFAAFSDSFNLGPDGKLLHIEDPESCQRAFNTAYSDIARKSPNLKPGQIWEQIKAQWPQVYWPFVAITAQ